MMGMRRLTLLTGAALLLASPVFAADCAGVGFADMPYVRFAKPSGAAPVAFAGGKHGATLGRQDVVALGAVSGAQVCAEKLKGHGSGWLPADALEIVPRINDTGAFAGEWRRGAATIRIDWHEDGRLTVEGRGAQAFSGDMDMRDGIGLYAAQGADPEKPEAPGCQLRMARGGEDMLVRDNGQCGGGFSGVYTRVKAAAR
jgi:hypothetical protein